MVFNNSYLYGEGEGSDDEEKTNNLIKKEIQDILNTDYGQGPIKLTNTPLVLSKRRKNVETYKKKFIKRIQNRKLAQLEDELLDEDLLLKNRKKNQETEEQLRREEIRDKRIYEFFAKIQELKKNNIEINTFIDKQIEQNKEVTNKDKDVGRLNFFLQEFNHNRIRAKYEIDMRHKKIGFLSPIIFSSPNDTFNLKKNINIK